MCEAQMGLFNWPKHAFKKLWTHLKKKVEQPKCCIKKWQHYWQRLQLRRKRLLAWANAIPHAIEDHKLFKNTSIHSPRHVINTDGEEVTGKSWMGRGQWHLLKSQQTLNLKLTWLLLRGVQSVLSFWCYAHRTVGKTRDFPYLKINTSQ